MKEKGIAQIVIVLILMAGLLVGLYLSQNPQIFKPRAAVSNPKAEFVDDSGNTIASTSNPNVKLKITRNSGSSSIPGPTAPFSLTVTPSLKTAPSPGAYNPAGSNTLFTRTVNTDPTKIGNGVYGVDYQIICKNANNQIVYRSMAEAIIESSFNRGEINVDEAKRQVEALPASGKSGSPETNCVKFSWDDPETEKFLNIDLPNLIQRGEVELGHIAYLDILTTRTAESAQQATKLRLEAIKKIYPCREPLSDPEVLKILHNTRLYLDNGDGSYNTENHPKLCQ